MLNVPLADDRAGDTGSDYGDCRNDHHGGGDPPGRGGLQGEKDRNQEEEQRHKPEYPDRCHLRNGKEDSGKADTGLRPSASP